MASVPTRIVLDEKEDVLGSVVRITIVADSELRGVAQKVLRAAFDECQRLDIEYSRFRTDNQLSKLNSRLDTWQEVGPELFFLLEQSRVIFEKTGGAFNLGVKGLLERWGYDSKYTFKPSASAENEKMMVGPPYELAHPNRVKIFYPIELGGLGKGYALDLMKNRLKDFSDFCIDAGGDLYAQGSPQSDEVAQHWEIFFEHPSDQQMVMGKVDVDGFFLASSNPLKRKWAEKYHHLVDPTLQRPANRMLAVYTQADSGLLADAYSTALFVLGFERAKEMLPSFPVDAMLVSPNSDIYRSEGFKGDLFTA